jgi:hypothetical protein
MGTIPRQNVIGCGRGGAADGLAYFGPIKELQAKGVTFDTLSLVSAASVMFGAWACGLSAEQIRDKMKSMKYDFVMDWERDVEKGRGSILSRIGKAVVVFLFTKGAWYRNVKKIYASTYSWQKVLQARRVRRLLIGFTTKDEMAKFGGNKKRFGLVTDALKLFKDLTPEECERAYLTVGMLFAGHDGIWRYSPTSRCLVQVSYTVIPLDVAILCAWKNPALKNFDVDIRDMSGKKMELEPFDLGGVNNEANMGVTEFPRERIVSFVCDDIVPPVLVGKRRLTEHVFNKHRPATIVKTLPRREKAFLSFTDEDIETEYAAQQQTDVFA